VSSLRVELFAYQSQFSLLPDLFVLVALISAINLIYFVYWWDSGLNSGLCAYKAGALLLEQHLHFAVVILEMGVSRTICLGWPQTMILPILASQVARITSVSHQRLAYVT
jgi:hypothetical protein